MLRGAILLAICLTAAFGAMRMGWVGDTAQAQLSQAYARN
jgi:hypothetical protein